MAKNFSAREGRENRKNLHQMANQELPDSENEENMDKSLHEESTPRVQRTVQWTSQRGTTATQQQPDQACKF